MRTGKKVQNVVSVDTYQRITPPTRWSMASNLSVAKKRSAKTPMKNGDTIAAMAVVMYAAPTWTAEMPRAPEVGPHRDEPRPPHEVLQEHHRRELDLDHGSTLILMLRQATQESCSWRPMYPSGLRP